MFSGASLREEECRLFDHDFVAPLVMQLLDVPTLVAFAATCGHHHRVLLPEEVRRRKDRFESIRSNIAVLLSPRHTLPLRDVRAAIQLQAEARALVDGGLGWLEARKHLQERVLQPGQCCSSCARDRLFLTERLLLKSHRPSDLAHQALLLPNLFYASERALAAAADDDDEDMFNDHPPLETTGATHLPSRRKPYAQDEYQEEALRVERQLHWMRHLWCGERLSYSRRHVREAVCRTLAGVVVTGGCGGSGTANGARALVRPYGCNLDHPLRLLCDAPGPDVEQVHQQIVQRTARRLVAGDLPEVEAFRVAVRTFVDEEPLSLPLWLWILTDVERLQVLGCS